MKSVVIIGPAHPLRGGLAIYNERLATQFINEQCDVEIYTFSLQYPNFLFPGKTQFSDSPPPNNLKIFPKINSVNPLNWLSVGQALKKKAPDLIVVRFWIPFMGPCLGSILRLVKKNKKTKIVAITDNVVPHEKRIGDNILTKYFIGSIDSFVTMSKKVQKDLQLFTTKKSKFLAHPLYDNFGAKIDKQKAREKLKLNTNKFTFLFFGFIRDYKGLDILINALDHFIPSKHNAQILIAGEYYSNEEVLKNQIKNSDHKNAILEHTHFISDKDVGLYFSASDVVIQPYRSATQSGVTPLAYHFEIPMIVTNVGGLPDMVPPGIGLISEPNEEDLARSMVKILNFDLNTFYSLIKEEKKKYSWSRMTDLIWNI